MSGALQAVRRWLVHQPAGVALELVCAEHPGPLRGSGARTVVRMATCVREVPAHILLELLTAGAATVLVRSDGCERPGQATAHLAPLVAALAAAGVPRLEILSADEAGTRTGVDETRGPRRPVMTPVLDASHMPVSRRDVFGLGAAPRAHGAEHAELPERRDPDDRRDPDERREPDERRDPDERLSAPQRLNAALAELVPPGAPDLPGPALRLAAPGCTACGVCVRACPTGALSVRCIGIADESPLSAGPAVTSLLQDPVACDGCGVCVQRCPADALRVAGSWGWGEVVRRVEGPALQPVATLMTTRCARCSARFPTIDAGPLCPVCAFRRTNPFASRLPPGYVPGSATG